MVTKRQPGRPGLNARQGQGRDFFSLPPRSNWLWGPHSLLSNGYQEGALSPAVKRPGRKADYSPAPSSEIKNAWNYTSNSP
jgi:hypothetical protein